MAEIIVLTKLDVKVKHMQALMAGLHPQQGETVKNSPRVWTDNTTTLSLQNLKGDTFTHEMDKHITVKVQLLQECIQHNFITLAHTQMT